MSDVLPQGEELRKAVKWIDANLEEEPERSLGKLAEEASVRFDLSPLQADFLMRFLRERAQSG